EEADAVSKRVALAAADLRGEAQPSVGHLEAGDLPVEERIAIHRVRGVGEEVAVLILAADLERVLALHEVQVGPPLPDVVARRVASGAGSAVVAYRGVDQ